MARLAGKTALVTGGGNGIGKASCLAFAREGAEVVIADYNRDAADALAGEIVAQGGRAVAVSGDVSDEQSVDHMVAAGLDAFGKIDALLDKAGEDRITVEL